MISPASWHRCDAGVAVPAAMTPFRPDAVMLWCRDAVQTSSTDIHGRNSDVRLRSHGADRRFIPGWVDRRQVHL
jgi:hypothetical protein